MNVANVTTSQSASLAVHGEVKRGSPHTEPKAPLTCGGEAPTARSEFFTLRRDPLIYEFATEEQEASYDAWLRAKVQKALDDPRPSVPHDGAMARIRRTIDAAASHLAQGGT